MDTGKDVALYCKDNKPEVCKPGSREASTESECCLFTVATAS